ncbi:putative endo-beta-1,6-glucanase [Pseudovirgaria hyperparasitica]|uniref:glucan endo-1,6-beta-glucosidase n=1 Tax=Pseudovirgaria hyperparasitica TaxID=470096 RepID=A0A6A6W1A2_9PEZI|nr:putative endo-beta-1,6-glucanase [Pseudovirgaria hyperparasitica]KAF2755754.1 putative endo-beta-1,6-glucanase [Pseudovirgaria hyperparasitica]
MSSRLITAFVSILPLASAWLPGHHSSIELSAFGVTNRSIAGRQTIVVPDKIRGVNVGSLFIIEPWMVGESWNRIGCSNQPSEFACVQQLGQEAANSAFRQHWDTWITQGEIQLMKDYGLNTIRIPIGYWMAEDLVRGDEHYPKGGLQFLDRFVGWAADAGMYVILDLHGGPGVQAANQGFTGNTVSEPQFFNSYNFDRAYGFLEFMTSRIHNPSTAQQYRSVGMLQVMNEPDRGYGNLVSEFYPNTLRRIRDRETQLNVADAARLHVQFMNTNWGAGRPAQNLPADDMLFFDSHTYFSFENSKEQSQQSYLTSSCAAQPGSDGDAPVVVGEWSVGINANAGGNGEFEVNSDNNLEFYRQYYGRQVGNFEKLAGWIFWSWKTEAGNDFRWSYKTAVERGIFDKDPGNAAANYGC